MHCPHCGHENNDLATRCSACGSPLPEPVTSIEDDPTVSQLLPPDENTAERQHAAVAAPEPDHEEPELREVAQVTGKYISTRRNRVAEFFATHQRAMGLGLAVLVVVIVGGTWLFLNAVNIPTYQEIEKGLEQFASSYEYAGGSYGPDLDIPLSSMTVTRREATQTPEGMEVGEGVSGTAYAVEAEAVYEDDALHVVRNLSATYVRDKDGWRVAGEPADQGISLTAKSGVSEQKVLDQMDAILAEASTGTGASLADIYGEDAGEFTIASDDFEPAGQGDTATCNVVIRCERPGDFSSYAGNVTAQFAFESQEWRLRKATADRDALQRNFEPLEGTWYGELAEHTANGANCYGAQDQQLVVHIESVGDASLGKGQVKGTITCLAHYHKQLTSDETSDAGDELVTEFPFAGTISTDHDEQTSSSLNIACTTSGSARGELSFVLSFGTDTDPSAAFARVTSTHAYKAPGFLFIPQTTEARFTDTYVLVRE